MPKLIFHPSGKSVEVHSGANLMASIIRGNMPIGSSCGASGICAKCTVRVLKGMENLSKPNPTEQTLLIREKLPEDTRVSCQTKIKDGEVTITTSYW